MTAVPSVAKTYQFDVNNVIPSQAELPFYQALVHGIKEAMIGFATLPWTVVSSSDSVTADATDNWSATTDLVWASGASAHSWIVLQQGAGGGQLCIDLNYAVSNVEKAEFRWSAGGNFTGGTVNARPTATDEIDISTKAGTADYIAANQTGTPAQNVFHVWHSTDGLVDRVAICSAGVLHTVWRFEAIQNPRTAHTNNPTVVGIVSNSTVTELTTTDIRQSGATACLTTEKDGTGTAYDLFSASVGGDTTAQSTLVDSTIGSVVEEWDSQTWAVEEHLACFTVGARGPKGSCYDSWIGQWQINVTGDTMPNSTSAREFAAFGPYVWPWTGDSTIPQVS